MTRAERWAKEDQERQLLQIGKPPESANAMSVAVAGYFAWKAGEAAGEAFSSSSDVTDSKSDD
jgi:hypothetical protein